MVPTKIAALDPGVTTGYAEGLINEEGHMYVVCGQSRWSHLELWGWLEDHQPDVIITERFEYRNRARSGLELFSRELIGVANLYTQMVMPPPHELVMQPAGTVVGKTSYFNNDRLKKEGLYKPARDHAMDALRHLLYWFEFGSGFQYNKRGYSRPGERTGE